MIIYLIRLYFLPRTPKNPPPQKKNWKVAIHNVNGDCTEFVDLATLTGDDELIVSEVFWVNELTLGIRATNRLQQNQWFFFSETITLQKIYRKHKLIKHYLIVLKKKVGLHWFRRQLYWSASAKQGWSASRIRTSKNTIAFFFFGLRLPDNPFKHAKS